MMHLTPRTTLRRICFPLFLFLVMTVAACDCSSGENVGITIEPLLSNPTSASQLAARVPVEIKFSDRTVMDEVRMVEVFVTPQGSDKSRKIGELYKSPFTFKWNSYQVTDGFYKIHAVAYSFRGDDFSTRKILVQVANNPPDLWFVNCINGQFIRGDYSVVVALNQTTIELKDPPTLLLNGQEGPKTVDTRAPFRFPIKTGDYNEGDVLDLVVTGVDVRGNQKRITCAPQVDNTPPTVRFTRPEQDGLLLGREFTVEFDPKDRFGIKEVRLWVDGSACALDPSDSQKECNNSNSWIGTQDPGYPIKVSLPKGYQSEQEILLTARSVDQAGNVSEPARMRVRIDPLAPEIFIRAPGSGEVFNDKIAFEARITDNQRLKKIEFSVDGGPKRITLLSRGQTTLTSEITLKFEETNAIKKFGLGKRTFVVRAEDMSGNVTVSKRDFRMGCGDSTDCPLGQVCFNSVCTVPAGLNQPCGAGTPCGIGTICTENSEPFCGGTKRQFCRKRCNPGNKFVQPQPCGQGFFCDKDNQVCLPADGCQPITNQGCQAGEQCILVDDDAGICYPVGSVKNGEVCDETCSSQDNCVKGSWCVFLLAVGRTSCMSVCDVKNPVTCRPGERCYALRWSFGGGSLNIGVCGPSN